MQDKKKGLQQYKWIREKKKNPGSVHVGIVVDKVALGQVFARVLRFCPVNFIPRVLHYLEPSSQELHSKQGLGASEQLLQGLSPQTKRPLEYGGFTVGLRLGGYDMSTGTSVIRNLSNPFNDDKK
jgi:hypothetical protein